MIHIKIQHTVVFVFVLAVSLLHCQIYASDDVTDGTIDNIDTTIHIIQVSLIKSYHSQDATIGDRAMYANYMCRLPHYQPVADVLIKDIALYDDDDDVHPDHILYGYPIARAVGYYDLKASIELVELYAKSKDQKYHSIIARTVAFSQHHRFIKIYLAGLAAESEDKKLIAKYQQMKIDIDQALELKKKTEN